MSGIITGQKATGSISVSVQSSGEATPTPTPTPPANGAPQITSTSADPTIVAPGGTSALVAVATDPDGDPLTFSWQASGGTLVPQGSQAVWTAPGTEGQFSITVRAEDGNGHTASASLAVSVAAVPSGTRNPALWPFTSTSAWNHPIGSSAIYAIETSPLWSPGSGGYINTRWNGVKVWFASAADPQERILTTTSWFPVKELTWWMPSGFHGALGGDQHAVVISPDRTQALEVIGAGETPSVRRGADGIWRFLSAHIIDLRTTTGWGVSPYDTTASYAANLGGLLRLDELETGIRHVLAAAVSTEALNRYAPGGKSWVWPAASSDDPNTYGTSGNLYIGSLLAIPASVDLTTLGIQHPWALRIAQAMQDYGIYIRDTASRGSSIVLYGESDLYSKLPADGTQFWQDLNKAIARLQIVTNNTPSSIGGGGTPRRPLAPPFSSTNVPPGFRDIALAYIDVRRSVNTHLGRA
ncbi:MAG TPA: PKD domain-containing protein [Gemmatimonadales bacterium]|nr:PKD domain-containing protein [Gemmatimonadales bacterium]